MDMAYMEVKRTDKGIWQRNKRIPPLKDIGQREHLRRRSLLTLQTWKPQEQHEKLCEHVSITNSHLVSVKLQKQLF